VKFKLDENLPVSAASVLAAATVIKAIQDLGSLAEPNLAGAVAVLQRGLLRIRHP
jgi:hypothetical protein